MWNFQRLRLLCCESWGVPPWELDERIQRGEVALSDVMETAALKCCVPFLGEAIAGWLDREKKDKSESKLKKMNSLAMMYRSTKDAELKAKILTQIEELQGGRKR